MPETPRTQIRSQTGDETALPEEPRRGMSWVSMLVWIVLAFVLAGLVAYRLVTPFFHH